MRKALSATIVRNGIDTHIGMNTNTPTSPEVNSIVCEHGSDRFAHIDISFTMITHTCTLACVCVAVFSSPVFFFLVQAYVKSTNTWLCTVNDDGTSATYTQMHAYDFTLGACVCLRICVFFFFFFFMNYTNDNDGNSSCTMCAHIHMHAHTEREEK